MRAKRWILGPALALGLAVSGLAQEAELSFSAGGFFSGEGIYREIYGSSVPFTLELWLKAWGSSHRSRGYSALSNFGLTVGYNWLRDNGQALGQEGGQEYPLEFRRTSVPLLAFCELDFKSVRVRVGAGVGIHSYREVWTTSTPAFEGRKVAPRFMIAALVGLSGRLSLIGSFVYEGIATGAGSLLSTNINLGGYQLLGGLCYRIF
jgi:hypothetical protein